MSAIEKAIRQIQLSATSNRSADGLAIDARIQLIVVLVFILVTLSLPIDNPAALVWLFIFPIIISEAIGVGYWRIFKRSLWVLPVVCVIGIFNPWLDTKIVWQIGSLTINRGWLTFTSLVLRGLLSFQALLLLIDNYGFYDICRCLQCLKCPKVLVTQLLMLHRYIGVMLHEALNMQRARQARGYGKEHYPLRMWGVFAGQLFIRSVNRAHRVNNAMMARGFTGEYHFKPYATMPKISDYLYMAAWFAVFIAIRFVDLTSLLSKLIVHHV